MHLHIVRPDPSEYGSGPDLSQVDDSPGRILIAHAVKDERAALRDLLVEQGHQVVLAADAEEALAHLEEFAADVALLDVLLPGGGGIDLCRRIKGTPHLTHVPVLLVRRTSHLSERIAGIEAGADDFLRRPGHSRTTTLRVRNAVRVKRLHDQAARDIKRLKDLERMRDDLTAMIVHDMRGPLTGIGGYSELLKTQVAHLPAALRFIHRIEGSAECLTGMVSDLLDVSRLEAGKMPLVASTVSLEALATEALELLGHSQGEGRVTISAPAESLPVTCDAHIIRRVFENLIGNALKYSTPDHPVHVFISGDGATSKVEVHDQGPGVPARLQERIFEKFAQGELRRELRARSTGLGLAFCKLAVEAHKGHIGVVSREGTGSTFWFELPCSPLVRWSSPVEVPAAVVLGRRAV